jgi:membrane-bound metal-dependent hydrolase YbcI (DUF457 family)
VFLGHYSVALASRKVCPYTSLGTLIIAAQWLDLLWPTLVLLGVEQVRVDPGNTRITPLAFDHYPWTHSLLMAGVWAAAFGGLYALFRRYTRGAWVVAGCVLSHWLLDFVTHRPDLPLWPGGPAVGLGLWNHPASTLTVEFASYALGLWIYAASTEAADAVGRRALTAFAIVLALVYAASVFGPPPPGPEAVAWAGQGQWLFVAWAVWIDRHRVAVRQW